MTEVIKIGLEGVVEIIPKRFGDARGFFSETYNEAVLEAHGITARFCQDSHSYSKEKGVLRGLHYQLPPFAQDKLVQVTRGSVLDVVVDIRKGSPTYAQWVSVVLSADKGNQLFVPKGFAHGFVTLKPDTEFVYKVSAFYAPNHDRAIRFDDPEIGIEWPDDPSYFIISDKDRHAPLLTDADNSFTC